MPREPLQRAIRILILMAPIATRGVLWTEDFVTSF